MANQIQLKVMSAEAWQGGNTQSLRYVRGIIRYLDAITGAGLAELIEVGQMTQRDEAITYEKLDAELQLRSEFYNEHLLMMDDRSFFDKEETEAESEEIK